MAAIVYTATDGFYHIGDEIASMMSSDDVVETLTGSEKLTDGDMAVLTSWTLLAGTGGGSIVSSGGEMLFTQGGTAVPMHAYQGYSVVEGETYIFDVTNITGGFANLRIGVGNNIPTADTVYEGSYNDKILVANTNIFITYTATATETVYVVISDEQATILTSTWDNATSRKSDRDLSSNLNGFMAFGGLTKELVLPSSNVTSVAFSGFTTGIYLQQPYNSDFDFSTGVFFFKFWLFENPNLVEETLFERDSAATNQRITAAINATGFLVFTVDDGTTVRSVISSIVVDDSVWRHITLRFNGSGDLYIYISYILDANTTGNPMLTMNNPSAVTRIGLNVQGLLPLTNGKIAGWKAYSDTPTDVERKTLFNSERILFELDGVFSIVGNSYGIDLNLAQVTRGLKVSKNEVITQDLTTETNIHGKKKTWRCNTLPVILSDLKNVRKFLDTAVDGQSFTFDERGTIIAPEYVRNVVLTSKNHQYKRIGGVDNFVTTFNIREE